MLKQYSAEEKIRIVLDGLRGEDSIAELCRREGIAQTCITNDPRSSWMPARSAWPAIPTYDDLFMHYSSSFTVSFYRPEA